MNWSEALFEPSGAIFQKIGVFFLILLTVLVFLLFGWLLAHLLRKAARALFKKLSLNELLAETWAGKFLRRGGITKSPTELLGGFLYWLIIVIFIVIASQSLGLDSTADLLDRFLIFLPRVIAFALILIFGIVFGSFMGKLFQIVSGNLGVKEFKVIGRILQVVIVLYAGVLALEQLGMAVFAVAASFNILWAAVCLTLALALGLGGKDWVKNLLDNFAKKRSGKGNSPKQSTQRVNRKKSKKAGGKQETFPYD